LLCLLWFFLACELISLVYNIYNIVTTHAETGWSTYTFLVTAVLSLFLTYWGLTGAINSIPSRLRVYAIVEGIIIVVNLILVVVYGITAFAIGAASGVAAGAAIVVIVYLVLVGLVYCLNIIAVVVAWRAHKEILESAPAVTVAFSGAGNPAGTPVTYGSVPASSPYYTAASPQPVYSQPGYNAV